MLNTYLTTATAVSDFFGLPSHVQLIGVAGGKLAINCGTVLLPLHQNHSLFYITEYAAHFFWL